MGFGKRTGVHFGPSTGSGHSTRGEWPAMSKLRRSASNGVRKENWSAFWPFDGLRAFDARGMACHEQAPKERVEWLPD
jgi:hypothetical protein